MTEPNSHYAPTNALGVYPDDARRCSDVINTHIAGLGFNAFGKWVAIRLSDGGSDGNVYDTKQQAVNHQLHESQCCYVRIPLDGMGPREALIFLRFNRELRDNGMRMSDPNHIDVPQTAKLRLIR